MKRYFSGLLIIPLISSIALAQLVKLKLPRQINVPNYNHYAPSLTANGLTMIYCSDYYVNEGNSVDMKIAHSKGVDNWSSGEDVTSVNKSGTLNLYGGHCISADGRKIFFTSRKTGGVGGFDIWMTEKKGNAWAAPQNLGKPINSTGSDGYPSVSADGKYLYFLRCAAMANSGCQDCKLFMSEGKGYGIWKSPTEIPLGGHMLYPRISKDGNSLTFSSNRAGGKGGYDIYQVKKQGDKWSAPKNLDFLNTSGDEIYADIPSQAEAILYSTKVDGYLTLFRGKLPEEFHPDKVVILSSKVNVPPGTAPAGFLQISDNKTGAPISINKIEKDGKISAVLPAGKAYDVAVTGGNDRFFWSTLIDATSLNRTQREEPEIILEVFEKGKVIYGNKGVFDSTTYQLLPGSVLECRRISKVMHARPDWKAEFILFPAGVSNNPPEDPNIAFEKMKAAIQPELSKAGISQETLTFVNGSGKAEEENSYVGWGIRFY